MKWIHFIIMLGCVMSLQAQTPIFDGEKAFDELVKQCEFGPRVPGSQGHVQCQAYLTATLKSLADEVVTQPFMFRYGAPAKTVTATNIYAKFQPKNPNRILVCAHWDTRPWADRDPNPANHNKPVLGANDGASGVAVLLELAKLLHEEPPAVGVDMVLLDAEDAGQYQDNDSWAVGSRQFVRHFGAMLYPKYGILLDMIGDADLTVYQEAFSVQYARPVVDKVWDAAQKLGIDSFVPQVKFSVFDDHIAFLSAGIPCIDLIDFDYPAWHTINDTPEQCSPVSLEKVGRLLTHLIYNEK